MAEEDALQNNENSLANLSTDDLKPRIYEGGFKTWECSVDLAGRVRSFVLEQQIADVWVVEVRLLLYIPYPLQPTFTNIFPY